MAEKFIPQTNIAELVTFSFNEPKIFVNQGQYGQYNTYSYGVVHRGVNKYFSADQRLYDALSKLGALQGRELEILKYEQGKYRHWKISENGQVIADSGANYAQNRAQADTAAKVGTYPPQAAKNDVEGQIAANLEERIREAFAKRDKYIDELLQAIKKLEARVSGLETLAAGQTSREALELHQSFEDTSSSFADDAIESLGIPVVK